MTAQERKACHAQPAAIASVAGSLVAGAVAGCISGLLLVGVPLGLFGVVNSFVKWLPPAFLAPYRLELLIGCGVWVGGCALAASSMQVAALRRRKRANALLEQDLAANVVHEDSYVIAEAVCVRVDGEHDGLGYVMRATSGEVFFTIHEGSACQEDIGWRTKLLGHDPRLDEWRPSREMLIATTLHAKLVVSAIFVGEAIAVPLQVYEGEELLDRAMGLGDVQRLTISWEDFVRTCVTPERVVQYPAECSECDYDLSATEPLADGGYRCPECGHVHHPAATEPLRRSA